MACPNFKNGPKTGLRPLGVKDGKNPTWHRILDAVGCSFPLLRRNCWPALEECYGQNEIYQVLKNVTRGCKFHIMWNFRISLGDLHKGK
jgi:hypothetical protein